MSMRLSGWRRQRASRALAMLDAPRSWRWGATDAPAAPLSFPPAPRHDADDHSRRVCGPSPPRAVPGPPRAARQFGLACPRPGPAGRAPGKTNPPAGLPSRRGSPRQPGAPAALASRPFSRPRRVLAAFQRLLPALRPECLGGPWVPAATPRRAGGDPEDRASPWLRGRQYHVQRIRLLRIPHDAYAQCALLGHYAVWHDVSSIEEVSR